MLKRRSIRGGVNGDPSESVNEPMSRRTALCISFTSADDHTLQLRARCSVLVIVLNTASGGCLTYESRREERPPAPPTNELLVHLRCTLALPSIPDPPSNTLLLFHISNGTELSAPLVVSTNFPIRSEPVHRLSFFFFGTYPACRPKQRTSYCYF